jgi:Rer1 family
VAYTLGIYLLNIFLAFISPKFDPSLELDGDEGVEDGTGAGGLPTKEEDEFRPFVRRLPEFKFWFSATRAIAISLVCSFFGAFDLPVFWPVLVMYWMILFFLTSMFAICKIELTIISETTDSTHDQVPLRPLHRRQGSIWQQIALQPLCRQLLFESLVSHIQNALIICTADA